MSYRPASPYIVGAMPGQMQANALAAARFRASLGGNMLVMGQQSPVVSMASLGSPYGQLGGLAGMQAGMGSPMVQMQTQQRMSMQQIRGQQGLIMKQQVNSLAKLMLQFV